MFYSVVSAISYFVRRSENKSARKSILNTESHRQLTAEEYKAVESYGVKGEINPDVYELNGKFIRHGFKSQGSEVWHDTIGEVEVELPHSARLFLDEVNYTEVIVYDKKKMLVITLNDNYNIIEGEKLSQEESQNKKNWENGVAGTIKNEEFVKLISGDEEVPDDAQKYLNYRILGSREETEAERQYHYHPGFKISAGISLIITLIALYISQDNNLTALIISAVAFLFFVFFLFRKKPLQSPSQVNRVSGILLESNGEIYLGDHQLQIPQHWRNRLNLDEHEHVYEITTDNRLLSGDGLAIEYDNHPRIFWGQHLWLTLIAAVALLFSLGHFSQVRSGFYYSMHYLMQNEPKLYQSLDDFHNHPPQAGDLVQINGTARCWVEKSTGYSDTGIENSCTTRLFDAPPQLPVSVKADPQLIELAEENWMHQVKFNSIQKTIMMMMAKRQNRTVDFNHIYRLSELPKLIALIDHICADDAHSSNCEPIKNQISDILDADDWAGVRKQVLKNGLTHSSLLKDEYRSDFQRAVKQLTDQKVKHNLQQVQQQLLAQSDKGQLLAIHPSLERLGYLGGSLKQLHYNLELASGAHNQLMDVTGIVATAGDQKLTIDQSESLANPQPYLARSGFTILATLMLLWQGFALILRKSKQGKQATNSLY